MKLSFLLLDTPLAVRPLACHGGKMDESAFHAMMERGLNEAKADKSRAASDVFADLKRELQ